MNHLVLQAAAKINIGLDICGLREDGYHTISTVMQSVSLFDTVFLHVRKEPGAIEVGCDRIAVPGGPKNIAYQAAERFYRALNAKPSATDIFIQKKIPWGAGMGGGSADGAAVLMGLNVLFRQPFTAERLSAIGAEVGADVPFCLLGSTALAGGIGEELTPLPPLPFCWIVVAKPGCSVSTKEAYALYDCKGVNRRPDMAAVQQALERGDWKRLNDVGTNVFEELCALEEVKRLKQMMLSRGAGFASMTGSGSAVFGIFTDKNRAEACEVDLQNEALFTAVVTPVGEGCKIQKIV